MLMTLISTLHNLSRSVECALLVVAGGKELAIAFLGGEMCLFLIFKIVRRDVWYVGERATREIEP